MTMKIYRKSEWLTLRLHGDALARLRKPTTPEWVDAVNALPKIDAAILATVAAVRGTLTGPVDLVIPGSEIEALARWMARWTLDLVGVEDEAGAALVWGELDERERTSLWESVCMDDLAHAWSCLRLAQMDNGKHLDAARKVAMAGLLPPEPAPAAQETAPVPVPVQEDAPSKPARTRSKRTKGEAS